MKPQATLVDLLDRRAADQPDRVGFVFYDKDLVPTRRLTYGALHERAWAVAAHLHATAVDASRERALLIYPDAVEFVPAFWGCVLAGTIAIPVPAPESLSGQAGQRSLQRLLAVAADAQVRFVLTTQRLANDLRDIVSAVPAFRDVALVDTDTIDRSDAGHWRARPPALEDLAYFQYTSGATRTPRGVMLTHANLAHQLEYLRASVGLAADDIGVTWLPHFHDYGLVEGLLEPVHAGYPVHVWAPRDFLARPLGWLELMTRVRATTSGGPPFGYDLCSRRLVAEQEPPALDLSAWRAAHVSAEPLPPAVLDRFASSMRPFGLRPDAIVPAYGLAEATLVVSTYFDHDAAPATLQLDAAALAGNRVRVVGSRGATDAPAAAPEGEHSSRRIVNSGKVHPGMDVRIVDPHTCEPCDADRIGEIWLRSPSVAAGYWNAPDASEETFGARLASTGEGPFLRSGDLGFLHDGHLFITGRLKDLIIIHGQNIYPQDIEWTVAACHPRLKGRVGAAFSVSAADLDPAASRDDVSERLAVVFETETPDPDEPAAGQQVVGAIRTAVGAEHGLAVHAVALIARGSLPRTSSGKIRRRATRTAWLRGELAPVTTWVLALETQPAVTGAPAPTAQFEAEVAAAFRELLGVSTLGPHDDFLELGGDSIKFVELAARLEEITSRELVLVPPLERLTVAAIAERLRWGAPGTTAAASSNASAGPEILKPQRRKRRTLGRRVDDILLRSLSVGLSEAVPYDRGAARLASASQRSWLASLMVERRCRPFRGLVQKLQHPSPDVMNALVQRHIHCNLGADWRVEALARLRESHRAGLDRWLTLEGAERLRLALDPGRGAILLVSHQALRWTVLVALAARGFGKLGLIGGEKALRRLGSAMPADLAVSDDREARGSAMHSRQLAQQLVRGRRHLDEGGLLAIAADGFEGRRRMEMTFAGMRRAFGRGFADLAVQTGAQALPARVSLEPDGRVVVTVDPALAPGGGAEDAPADRLIAGYVEWLERLWRADLASFSWSHLDKVQDLEDRAAAG